METDEKGRGRARRNGSETSRLERETGIEPASLAWKAKVLPLNYSRLAIRVAPVATTRPATREAKVVPTMVLMTARPVWWWRLDSNQRRRKPTDLQSAPFSHSGTPPRRTANYSRKKSAARLPASSRRRSPGAECRMSALADAANREAPRTLRYPTAGPRQPAGPAGLSLSPAPRPPETRCRRPAARLRQPRAARSASSPGRAAALPGG